MSRFTIFRKTLALLSGLVCFMYGAWLIGKDDTKACAFILMAIYIKIGEDQ